MHPLNDRILLMGSTGFTAQLLWPLLSSKYTNIFSYNRSHDGELSDFLKSDKFFSMDVIINCIGPYNLTGNEIAEAIIEKGKKYIDISGELNFVKNSFENLSEKAMTKKATLIHSCAFESFFADHLVNLIATPGEEIQTLNSYYKFDQTKPSPGTRASAKLHGFFSRMEVLNGDWLEHNENERPTEVVFYPGKSKFFAPYPEIYFFKQRFKAQNIASYYLIESSEADMLLALSSNANKAKKPLEKIIKKLQKSQYKGPESEEREQQKFEIFVTKTSDKEEKIVKLSGTDMYLRTAEAIFLTLDHLIQTNKKGILSPYEFIGNMSVFDSICERAKLKVEILV